MYTISDSLVDYSLNNPQDPFVKKRLGTSNNQCQLLYCCNTCLFTEDHNEIMSKIDKKMAPYYDQLAQEFCIAKNDRTTIRANALTKVNIQWEGLNEVVDTWLRGNNEAYVKGVRPNVRWLVEAVGKIDPVHGTKLATGIHTYCHIAVIQYAEVCCMMFEIDRFLWYVANKKPKYSTTHNISCCQ